MLNSEALEVGIGMVFLFLLMSVICMAVQEWLEGIFKWRAMDLERAVRTLLDDGDGVLTSFVYRHPLVYSLFPGRYESAQLTGSPATPGIGAKHVRLRARRNLPSYIPAASFTTAFLDLVARGPVSDAAGAEQDASGELLSVALLHRRAAALSSPHLRRVMLSAIDHCGGDLEKLRLNIQAWFDGTMDRAAGWYKRRTQTMLFVLGLVMAGVLNVDALHVMQRLTADKAFRDVVVSQAALASAPDTSAPNTGEARPALDRLKEARSAIDSVGMPVGWHTVSDGRWLPWVPRQLCRNPYSSLNPVDSAEQPSCATRSDEMSGWFRAFTGWLVTALAVMLGAPFWFDILNKFMVIRSTVKPREKSPEEGSEDRQAKDKAAAPAAPMLLASQAALASQAPPVLGAVAPTPALTAILVPAPLPVAPEPAAAESIKAESAAAAVAAESAAAVLAGPFEPHQWRAGYTNPNDEVPI